MQSKAATLLLTALVASLAAAQSINLVNNPNSTTSATRDLQEKRDWWCSATNVHDRNYNASMLYYYRATRFNFLGYWTTNVIDYLRGGSTTSFIQTMKWPFGLLLTLLCITFIVWIFFLIYLCAFRKQTRNEPNLTNCLRFSLILLLLFAGLFVIIMIFMGFSEVSQRRSKCQVLNVGNMLVNGYVSQMNGNQYVGLAALNQAIFNFQSEYTNAGTVVNQAARIVTNNFPLSTQDAIQRLQSVAGAYQGSATTSPMGLIDIPNSMRNMNGWFNNAAKAEFSNAHQAGSTLHNAGQSILNIQNGIVNSNSGSIVNSANTLGAFFRNMTGDMAGVSLESYYQLRNRYTYAAGGYWAIFAISIIIIIIAAYVIAKVMKIQSDPAEPRNFGFLKALLAILAFFLVWYCILTIILLAGSASISSFCNILTNVNQGNWQYVDNLDIKWPGNSRHVLKECTIGKSGDLFNFQTLFPGISESPFASDIQNIITGVLNYQGWYANSQISGSSSLALVNSQYQAIRSGIEYDYPNVLDQFKTLYSSWTNSSINSGSGIPSLTTFNCSAIASANRTRCQPLDAVAGISFGSDATYSNYTIAQNLRRYIQSEQALLSGIWDNLRERNDQLTPGQAFRNFKLSFDQRRSDVQDIQTAFSKTFSVFAPYRGQALYTFDCRNIKREMLILEDHYCFELNYWVNILVIIAAVSLLVLFILCWALCAAVREADTEGEIVNYPIPAAEENKGDINERELIPQA